MELNFACTTTNIIRHDKASPTGSEEINQSIRHQQLARPLKLIKITQQAITTNNSNMDLFILSSYVSFMEQMIIQNETRKVELELPGVTSTRQTTVILWKFRGTRAGLVSVVAQLLEIIFLIETI